MKITAVSGVSLIALLHTAGLGAPVAHAQSQALPPEPEAAQREEAGLSTIIVTATRREASLQDVAVATTVLSGDDASRAGVTQTNQLALLVPNLTIGGTADSQPKFTLRGIGTVDQFQNLNPGVAIYTDDVYNGLGVAQTFAMFDLERVEVLRGPQGTLYGKNATGGAVNIISRKPAFENSAGLMAAVGAYNLGFSEGFVNVAPSDTLAARVSFTLLSRDGFSFNTFRGRDEDRADRWALRGQIRFAPSDTAEFNLRADVGRNRGDLKTRRFAGGLVPDATNPRGFRETGLLDGIDTSAQGVVSNINNNPAGTVIGYVDTPQMRRFVSDLDQIDRINQWGVSGTGRIALSDTVTLNFVSAYRDVSRDTVTDSDVSGLDLFATGLSNDSHFWSQEIRLNGQWGTIDWILGGHYYNEEHTGRNSARLFGCFFAAQPCRVNYVPPGFTAAQLTGLALVPRAPTVLLPRYEQRNESLAGFAEASLPVTETLTVTAGLRYTTEKREITASLTSNNPFLGAAFGPASFAKRFNDLSGRVMLEYRPNADVLAYVSYATAFKAGNFNGGFSRSLAELQSLPPPRAGQTTPADFDPTKPYPVNPEKLRALEGGLKLQPAGNLRANLAAFHYWYEDLQVTTIVNAVASLRNASQARVWGAELEVDWRPVPQLALRLAGGYLNSRYEDFLDLERNPVTGQSLLIDRSGNQLVNAPEWSVVMGAEHTLPFGSSWQIRSSADARYQSRVFFQPDNIERLSQPGYVLANARIGIERRDGTLGIALIAENLFDKSYVVDGNRNGSPFFVDALTFGTPRLWSLQISTKF